MSEELWICKWSYGFSPFCKTVFYSLTLLFAQQNKVKSLHILLQRFSGFDECSFIHSASIYCPLCIGHGVGPRYSILSRTWCRNRSRKSVEFWRHKMEVIPWVGVLEFESLACHVLSVWPWKGHNFSKLQPHTGRMWSLIHLSQDCYDSLMTMYRKYLSAGNF